MRKIRSSGSVEGVISDGHSYSDCSSYRFLHQDGDTYVFQAGPVIGRFAAALLDSPLPWTRMRRVYALLSLVRRYGPTRVTAVCAVALAADMLDVPRLRRMLELGVTTPPPAAPARALPRARYLRPAHQYALPFRAAPSSRSRDDHY